MTDEGPQRPPRGRRARGSADPGPDYPGDLPRSAYPPPQYPEVGPGQRRRATPGDPQAARDYPAPPGEAARGYDRTGAPGSHTRWSSRPGETAGDYGRAGAPGHGTRGYRAPPPAKCPVTPGPPHRAEQSLVREGKRTPARAGGVSRRPPRAGRTIPGGMRADAMRVADASRAPRGAGGPRHLVRIPARRVTLIPAAIPGVVRGLRPTPDRGRQRRGDAPVPPGGPLPGDRSVPPGGPGVDGYLTAPPQQARLDGARSSPAGQATGEPPAADWTSAPRRGRRHRPEPHPEAGPAPAVRDRPAERTGPSRHGRAPGGSGVGWDSPLEAGPGQAPATGPAGGVRAAPGRTASGWAGSGPLPPGRRSPEPVGRGRGGPAGFVADPEFDLGDRRAQEREPARRPASGPSAIQPPADPRAADEAGRDRRPRGRAAVREAPAERPAEHDEVAPAGGGRSPRAARSGRRSGRRRSRRLLMIGAGLAVILGGAAVAAESGLFGGGPHHVLVTPDKLGSYVRRPQLEKQMNASQLQRQVIAKSAGQASHVVSAVYEDGTGATSTKTPQMILLDRRQPVRGLTGRLHRELHPAVQGRLRDQRGIARRVGGVRQRPGQRAGQRRTVHLGRQRHVWRGGLAHDERDQAGRAVAGHPADGRARRQVRTRAGGSGRLAGGLCRRIAVSGCSRRSAGRILAVLRARPAQREPDDRDSQGRGEHSQAHQFAADQPGAERERRRRVGDPHTAGVGQHRGVRAGAGARLRRHSREDGAG